MSIVLCRIDNRLIHSQVTAQWIPSVDANLILVANDKIAEDAFAQSLMNTAATSLCETCYYSIEETIEVIQNIDEKQRVAIICETPYDVLKLINGGVLITKVNIGNMHITEGKRQVAATVFVDDGDATVFKTILEKGVELEIRRVPSDIKESVEKLFK